MDLSMTFDYINNGLLLVKLKAYGFSKRALSFMCKLPEEQKTKSSNQQ